MDIGVSHVLGSINNDFAICYGTFQMAGSAMGVVKCYTRYVMRPFGELGRNCTHTIVVSDQVRSMLRNGDVMATYATIGVRFRHCCHLGGMETGAAAYSVARRTFAYKISSGKRRYLDGTVAVAHNASVRRQRVGKWNRAYTIVFGATAMTALATCINLVVMCRCKIFWKNLGG
jgi:hypothetical protein